MGPLKVLLGQPWRKSVTSKGAIVCDPISDLDRSLFSAELQYYGGLVVCESCPPFVQEHIIAMHNAALMDTRKMRCVWSEDDATVSDPDHEGVDAAYRRLFGEDFNCNRAVLKCDCGDGNLYRMPNGVAVWASFPGGSAIYVDP